MVLKLMVQTEPGRGDSGFLFELIFVKHFVLKLNFINLEEPAISGRLGIPYPSREIGNVAIGYVDGNQVPIEVIA